MTTRLERLSTWAAALRPEDVPGRVRELAVSQILSQLGSIRAGAAHPLGAKLIDAFGAPTQNDPKAAAAVLAGLGSWLNLDDTAYAGHLSNSTVAVPLAFARARGLDGASLVTAVVAANECAARITAAATLGPLRGQSAVHTHLAGAVAGRLKCEGAPAELWTNAFALAFAMPNWPLMRAFLASDARLLCTVTPVRTAFDACDAAYAGLSGAADLMEHPDGFLARFATVPLPDLVDHRLGDRWHTETLSFKLHPGGPGIDAAVDCAAELGPLRSDEIEDVLVEASAYTLMADKTARRYIDGADSPLGALVLTVAYPVATALLTGHLTAADLDPPASADPTRWAVADRVRLEHDPAMTRELFAAEAPFGEALRHAGAAAQPWLHGFGGAELAAAAAAAGPGAGGDFAHATKATPARVTVRLTDGRTLIGERSIPVGAAGADTRARHPELMRAKFVALGGSAEVAEAAVKLDSMTAVELAEWVVAALS
ncbi:MmgE/PrpD family protein [Actinokineospora sp.]|uniref:MmgE/PrpD family protein n=1 Tax=Actinokineospora sp. TaxID=1872133 RepID=UPI0040377795